MAAYKELLQREDRRDKLGGMLESMAVEKAVMVRQCLLRQRSDMLAADVHLTLVLQACRAREGRGS